MNRTFKVDKEKIIEILSQVNGVKAINMEYIPDEVGRGFEDTIKVLYEPQENEEFQIIGKSVELMNELEGLIEDYELDVDIDVRVTDRPEIFYGYDLGRKGCKGIIEVNQDDNR